MKMMIYGYLRVSTDDQDYNSQKQGVDSFASQKGWNIDEYITDNGVSGGKDPSKRNLGTLLNKIQEHDIIIASEISRLGRDLLMVMEILNHCMKVGAKVYTVKDNYVLGDDVQSKVLAFAFGLSAEIERKMIQMRTKEGLALKIKKGVLLGRPRKPGNNISQHSITDEIKDKIVYQYNLGVPERRIAENVGINRNTLSLALVLTGIKKNDAMLERLARKREERAEEYREDLQIVDFDKNYVRKLIESNLTIPEIHEKLHHYTYQQVYDSISADYDLNMLYRSHGQKRVKGVK